MQAERPWQRLFSGRGRSAVAIGALTALLFAGASAPSDSGDIGVDTAASAASPARSSGGGYAKVQRSEALAQIAAKGNDEPVEVAGLRQERREVFANPDGSFTAYEHAEPVRTVRGGRWVKVDTALVQRTDGTWGPKAATVELGFSDGGDGPFARMRRAGREYALSWPGGDLPEPEVTRDTVTYAGVLPGVDLVVRAEVDGLAHLLVVKTAEAARNPELERIELGLETDGLKVREGPNGTLLAVDAEVGGTVFEGAKPVMWDSSPAGEQQAPEQAAGPAPRTSKTAGASASAAAEGPGDRGRTAPLGLEVTEDRLTLLPDPGMLKGKDTVFPVVIDPIQRTTSRTAWTSVMSGMPSEQDWKYSGSAGAGKCPTDFNPVSCNGVGVRRLLFTTPMSFYKGKQIINASFAGRLEHVYWADARAEPVDLYRVGGKNYTITSSSDWSNTKDDWDDFLMTVDKKISPTSCSGQANLRFEGGELLSEVRNAAADNWSSMSLGIRAKDEGSFGGWKRICGNTYLKIGYNNPPKQITKGLMSSNPGGKCVWGADRPYSDEPPQLRTEARDPDHNSSTTDQVKVQFKVAWTDGGGTEHSYTADTGYKSPNSGTSFTHTVKSSIPQNTVIYWSARAYDGDGWGPWSYDGDAQRCEFVYDSTRPGAPQVVSTQYPNDEVAHHGVGTVGTFTFVPNPDDDGDTVTYRYSFADAPKVTVAANANGAPTPVTWTPTRPGRSWVTVEAYDAAENASAPAHYEFLVTDGKPAAGQWNLADEAGSEAAHDETGGHAATPGSASGVTFGVQGPGGTADSAVRLDGGEDAYLDTGAAVLDTDAGFTVSAWVRPTSLDRDMAVISQDGTGEPGFTLGYDATAGTWAFSVPVNDVEPLGEWQASAAVSVVEDQWVLLTGVYDPGAVGGPQLTIYVNQQAKGTVKRPFGWAALGALQIGRAVAKTGYRDNFAGDLAEVRAFDRVLPATQVAELMTVRPQRKGYWPLDSATGGSSENVQTGGPPLALNGNAVVYRPADPLLDTPPLVGEGHLTLDGNGDWAATATPPATGDSSFTVTARAQLTALDAEESQAVFSLPGTQADRAVVRFQKSTGQWELAVAQEDTADAEVTVFTDDQELPVTGGAGQHLALVYDAFANDLRLYVEGQLAAAAHGADDTLWAATGGLQIGRSSQGGGSEYFAGALDEVRVYAGAVDPVGVARMARLTGDPDL